MSKVFFILIIFSVYFLDFLSYCSHSGNNGMGTVLFTASDLHKECWSPEEIALMTTRMILENLLPDVKILTIDSDDYIADQRSEKKCHAAERNI
ncbi:hypothetical protein NQ317_009410 [Molorchus minor]|uniref:Uncharacterized protein n=1 Tax=Molorchus minor TaxID=1323400 RepID=A0ABQ9JQS8_9CUCU|nr:hypothetical protein NQ317_009410 [Molorchus minor]